MPGPTLIRFSSQGRCPRNIQFWMTINPFQCRVTRNIRFWMTINTFQFWMKRNIQIRMIFAQIPHYIEDGVIIIQFWMIIESLVMIIQMWMKMWGKNHPYLQMKHTSILYTHYTMVCCHGRCYHNYISSIYSSQFSYEQDGGYKDFTSHKISNELSTPQWDHLIQLQFRQSCTQHII